MKLLTLTVILGLTSFNCYAQLKNPSTEIRYLSGAGKDDAVLWDFFCTEGRKSGEWTKIPVPSNWELQGFGTYQYGRDHERNTFPKEQGRYKFNFSVPQ